MKPRFALGLAALALGAAAPSGDEAAIRTLRAGNNAAILKRDAAAMQAAYAADYTLIRGYAGTVVHGGPGLVQEWTATDWKDPLFITYARTPTRVEISSDGRRAGEWGTWEGRWKPGAPVLRRTGEYLAVWIATPAGWRLRSESFVALGCEGPGC